MTTWTFRVLETWNGYDSSTIRQHLHPPFVVSCGIFSKCLANRLPVWRVDINCDESFDSSQIESIRQHFHGLKVINCGIFLSVLQIDFWYTSRSIRVKLSRFDNIFNNPWQLLANWLSVCVSILWEMVYQISGITRRINRESTSVERFANCPRRIVAVWVYWTTLICYFHYLAFVEIEEPTSFLSPCCWSVSDCSSCVSFFMFESPRCIFVSLVSNFILDEMFEFML